MAKIIRLLGLVVLVWLLAGPAAAKDADWRLEKDEAGIQVHTRAVDGSAYRAIRGTTRVRGRLSSIVALLQDPEYWPKLNKLFSSVRVHKQVSPTESLLHIRMDMPWPVTDRDLLSRRQVAQNPVSGAVSITEIATTGLKNPEKSYVRIVRSSQRWILTPNRDGTVDLEWSTHTDPNGPIPAAIVNHLSVGAPFNSLTTLRAAIEAGEYRDAVLAYIVDP